MFRILSRKNDFLRKSVRFVMRVKYVRQIATNCFTADGKKANILLALGHNLVNHAVFLGFLSGHPVVAVAVGEHFVKRLATML